MFAFGNKKQIFKDTFLTISIKNRLCSLFLHHCSWLWISLINQINLLIQKLFSQFFGTGDPRYSRFTALTVHIELKWNLTSDLFAVLLTQTNCKENLYNAVGMVNSKIINWLGWSINDVTLFTSCTFVHYFLHHRITSVTWVVTNAIV